MRILPLVERILPREANNDYRGSPIPLYVCVVLMLPMTFRSVITLGGFFWLGLGFRLGRTSFRCTTFFGGFLRALFSRRGLGGFVLPFVSTQPDRDGEATQRKHQRRREVTTETSHRN